MLQARPEEELDDLSGLYEANIASPSRQQLRRHCHSRLVVYFRWQLFCSYLRVVNSGNGRRCVVRFGHHRRCSGKDRRCTGMPAPTGCRERLKATRWPLPPELDANSVPVPPDFRRGCPSQPDRQRRLPWTHCARRDRDPVFRRLKWRGRLVWRNAGYHRLHRWPLDAPH